MSGQVASHTSTFPPFHGTMAAPPGHLPSEQYRGPWVRDGRGSCSTKGHVVDCHMMGVTSPAEAAAEAMGTKMIDNCST